jgi:hypothetical protein
LFGFVFVEEMTGPMASLRCRHRDRGLAGFHHRQGKNATGFHQEKWWLNQKKMVF